MNIEKLPDQESKREFVPNEATLAAIRFQELYGQRADNPDIARSANEAFEDVVSLTYPVLWPALQGFAGSNTDAAEEVLQDTYTRAFRALSRDKFNAQGQVSTWLYRIMLNNLSSYYKKESRRRSIEFPNIEPLDYDSPLNAISTEELVISDDMVARIIAVVDTLHISERDRKMFDMLHFQGKTYAEIGLAIGITALAAKVAMNRVHKKLRPRL